MEHLNLILKKIPRLIMGFIIIAFGTNMTRYSGLGLNPWGTLHEGISIVTGISFGRVTQLTGVAVLLLSLFIKLYPGIGTILNMFFIGFFVDLIDRLGIIPRVDMISGRMLYLLLGMFLFNFGVYIYMSGRLGAGPRDGLMVGLVRLTGKPVSIVRPAMEFTVIALGILLGGTFGIGTIINAFGGGYMLNFIFKHFNYDPSINKNIALARAVKEPA